jgi:hypothetical protein
MLPVNVIGVTCCAEASGGLVALIPQCPRFLFCLSKKPVILFFWLACHVQSRDAAHDPAVVDARTRQVLCVSDGIRISVEVAVDHRLLETLTTERRLEPQPILFDGSAKRRIEIVDLEDLADVGEAALLEIIGEVVAVPRITGPVSKYRSAERIAAVFRNHVDAQTALPHLGGIGARGIADFLEHPVVPVIAAVLS